VAQPTSNARSSAGTKEDVRIICIIVE